MQVIFRNKQLRKAFEVSSLAARRWGDQVGRKYVQRLEVLNALPVFDDVKTVRSLRAHPLKEPREGQWALDLTDRWRLIVIPSEDGKTVTIEEVTNHYGD